MRINTLKKVGQAECKTETQKTGGSGDRAEIIVERRGVRFPPGDGGHRRNREPKRGERFQQGVTNKEKAGLTRGKKTVNFWTKWRSVQEPAENDKRRESGRESTMCRDD